MRRLNSGIILHGLIYSKNILQDNTLYKDILKSQKQQKKGNIYGEGHRKWYGKGHRKGKIQAVY